MAGGEWRVAGRALTVLDKCRNELSREASLSQERVHWGGGDRLHTDPDGSARCTWTGYRSRCTGGERTRQAARSSILGSGNGSWCLVAMRWQKAMCGGRESAVIATSL